MRDFVARLDGTRWARWFLTLRHRQAIRVMAVDLLEDGGPGGEWRPREPLRDQVSGR